MYNEITGEEEYIATVIFQTDKVLTTFSSDREVLRKWICSYSDDINFLSGNIDDGSFTIRKAVKQDKILVESQAECQITPVEKADETKRILSKWMNF
jgi:hypothetical protein